jgi:solute:Na+ symporter, SSS family
MAWLDWLVIAAYVLGVIGIGVHFSRRASSSADAWLVADRKLPWWVIGLSDVASSAGADAFWVLVVFSGAFVGLGRFYWLSAVVSLPLGVLWARYWRRLRLASAGEIYEVRYGGVAAARFRGFFVVYSALITSAIVLGYILQGFSQIMAPFLGWPVDVVLLVFCGVSMVYTAMSGLLGVAYSDVPQFVLLLVGRVALAFVLVDAAGGMSAMLDTVETLRGPEFLRPFPLGSEPMYGKWTVEPKTLVALVAAGLFSIAGTRSAVVQRSLAARSEADAALGQVFNAVLTLAVRIVPLVVIGLSAIALVNDIDDPTLAWGQLVSDHAGPGLLGVLMVGLVAGYMSTIDTFLNFMTAGLFNDFYRRHLRPHANDREQLWFCRGATVAVTLVAYLWARVLVGHIDADWLNFINSVVGLFMLPLALLRWTWWRLNIWGEIVAFVGGVPLAYIVWFPLGFKDQPYWQAFTVLFVVGWSTIIAATLLTRAEDRSVLERFYRTVRPPGLWGPVADALESEIGETARREWRLDVCAAGAGLVFCVSLTTAVGAGFGRQWWLLAAMAVTLVASATAFYRFTLAADRLRRTVAAEDGAAS